MNFFRKATLIFKYLGPGWVAFRLGYALQMRTGALKRSTPCRAWDKINPGAKLPDWLRALELPPEGKGWGSRCVTEADGLALGEFVLFSHHQKQLGNPPDWHKNSFTGQSAPRGRHWSELGDFDFGDIKAIWEPSRFGWAFTLVRAHARTHEARDAELFWRLFENWCAQNLPNEGVNWKCGQEATFRLMAVTFALAQFGRLPSATPERMELWSRFVTFTGTRIRANLPYALSQSNNHGVSECVGLITAGLLQESAELGDAWKSMGLAKLRRQLDELVYADGGFSQHSLVYHRVLLHDLLWLVRLLRLAGQAAPDWLILKTRAALVFLENFVEADTGGAPLFGPNDGSQILPLDECAYDDFRSVVQAGFALLDNQRAYPPGPWDESAFWLTGKIPSELPRREPVPVERSHAAISGYFQWRSGAAKLFLICPTHFCHRPGQADLLHADVWWRGRPIAHDAGTYSYNAPGIFDGAFSQSAAHNTPMLARREPLQKAGRFLYLPWPQGSAQWLEGDKIFRASHDGYGEAAQVSRAISIPGAGVFEVVDEFRLRQPGQVRVHWLLADADWRLDASARTVAANIGGDNYIISWKSAADAQSATLVRAQPDSARGWWSRHYLAVEPAVSLELLFDAESELKITTRFAPGAP